MRFNVIHFRLFKEKFCECHLLCEENWKIQHLDSYALAGIQFLEESSGVEEAQACE